LRHDPVFRLGVGRKPFDTDETAAPLASGSTISRFEHAVSRKDIDRISEALVDQFIAGYATPPEALVLDLDHAEDAVIHRLAEPALQRACALWAEVQTHDVVPDAVRVYDEFDYAARSWSKPQRVVHKAEVMALGENPRFVVTSLTAPDPRRV
jgi:hypothetical protein